MSWNSPYEQWFEFKQMFSIMLITAVLLISIRAENRKMGEHVSPLVVFSKISLLSFKKTNTPGGSQLSFSLMQTARHICGSVYCFQMKTLLNCRMCFPPAALDNS